MIALLLLVAGAVTALYGHMLMQFNPVEKRANGALVAVVGYALAVFGVILMALT